jgi:DNA-binding transcriptional MerR regulator
MRIGEFARAAGVSQKTLRFYDQRGLFKPAFRHPLSGYREYHPTQLPELATLLALRELGVTVAELKALRRSPSHRRGLLERARADLERTLERGARSLAWLTAELGHRPEAAHDVVLRARPALRVVSLRRTLGDTRDAAELERELLDRVPEVYRARRRGTLWHRCAGDPGPPEAECFVEVRGAPPGLEAHVLPGVVAACGFSADDEGAANQAFDDVRRWVRLHGHDVAATKREYLWNGALEVQFPVALTPSG